MMVAPSVLRMACGSVVESSPHNMPFGSSLANGTVTEAGSAEKELVGATVLLERRSLEATAELADANTLETAELADANAALEAPELAVAAALLAMPDDAAAGAADAYLARSTAQSIALLKVSMVKLDRCRAGELSELTLSSCTRLPYIPELA